MTKYHEPAVVLDADVLVDFLRGRPEAVKLVQSCSGRSVLPAVVVAELYAGVRDGKERTTLDAFVSLFRVVPVDGDVAVAGGLYRRDYGPSHGISLADALIAATVDAEQATLVTHCCIRACSCVI